MIDDYEPRPKASQTVAAKKRRPTTDDRRLTNDDASSTIPARRLLPFGIGAIILIVAILATQQQFDRAPSPLAITPGPSTAAFLSAPTAAPAPTTEPTVTIRTIGAYAAPDGLLLGQIEADRQISPIAHYGAGWVQADVSGSGVVWLRVSDVPGVAIVGPDLVPAAAAPQTGRGLPVDTSGSPSDAPTVEPTPAPATEPTATPTVWVTSAPAAAPDFQKPDIKGTCQFIGCLGQNAVDLARAQACHALYWQYGDADAETIPEPDLSAVRGCVWEGLYR